MMNHPLESLEDVLDLLHRLDLADDLMDYKIDYGDFALTKKVVIVGSNPGSESPDNTAFHEATKSGKTVRSWFNDEQIHVHFRNLHDIKCDIRSLPRLDSRDREYHKRILISLIGYKYKIVACGNYVSEQLRLMGVPHFEMPHPSGLNRFWNDKEAGAAKIKEMLEWVKNGK